MSDVVRGSIVLQTINQTVNKIDYFYVETLFRQVKSGLSLNIYLTANSKYIACFTFNILIKRIQKSMYGAL